MLKKIVFTFSFLCAALAPFAATVSFAGHENLTSLNARVLKKTLIGSYLKEIPPQFKKYFHFNRFSFTAPVKNIKVYYLSPVIANPGFSGYHTVMIKLLDKNNGELRGIAYVSFKTEIFAPVAVAKRTIGKFQIIKPDDVKISYRNIPGLNDGYYLGAAGPAGREAKFFIPVNSALTGANTERKRIINFGNTVNVVYRVSGLYLKTKGIALQAGALNSSIRVRNIYSGAILDCVVKSDKIVEAR